MKKLMHWVVITLMGVTCVGAFTAEAAITNEGIVQTQQRGQHPPRGGVQNRSTRISPQQHAQNRLDAIAKAAGLTEEEKVLVGAELKKYDDIRLQTWVETQKIHDDITQLGDNATDKQYRDSLQKLDELNTKRQKASQDFLSALVQKLTPKKAYLVHRSFRSFNANTGRSLRQS